MATGQRRNLWRERRALYCGRRETRRPTAASCWRAWILRPTPMPAWNRCSASARISALPDRCSRVAAVPIHPEIESAGTRREVEEAAIRTSETMNLGDEFEGEVGSEQVCRALWQEVVQYCHRCAALCHGGLARRRQRGALSAWRLCCRRPGVRRRLRAEWLLPVLAMRMGRWLSSTACIRNLAGNVRPTHPVWP